MEIFREIVGAVSPLRWVGFSFLAIAASAWLFDLYRWWREKRQVSPQR